MKPFKCSCKKSFSTLESLRHHIAVTSHRITGRGSSHFINDSDEPFIDAALREILKKGHKVFIDVDELRDVLITVESKDEAILFMHNCTSLTEAVYLAKVAADNNFPKKPKENDHDYGHEHQFPY